MKSIFYTLIACFIAFSSFSQEAPCGSTASFCEKHMVDNYVSDGQSYRAFLAEEDLAEFRATLYGGNTYRIAGCSGLENGNLIYSLYDKDKNIIFSSDKYENTSYWDFEVENTFDCIIEAKLDLEKIESGCAVILIAFEK